MTPCTYSAIGDPSSLMHAKQFGNFSMQWAVKNSEGAMNSFNQPPISDIAELQPLLKNRLYISLFLTCLQGAAYWLFAVGIAQINGRIEVERYTETLKLLKLGRDECIRTIRFPDGKPFTPDLVSLTEILFAKLFHSLLRDFQLTKSQDPDELNFKLSEAASTFFAYLSQSFGITLEPHNELICATLIDEMAIATVTAMNGTMQVHH